MRKFVTSPNRRVIYCVLAVMLAVVLIAAACTFEVLYQVDLNSGRVMRSARVYGMTVSAKPLHTTLSRIVEGDADGSSSNANWKTDSVFSILSNTKHPQYHGVMQSMTSLTEALSIVNYSDSYNRYVARSALNGLKERGLFVVEVDGSKIILHFSDGDIVFDG